MITSDRLARLGSGVFDRNDRRKSVYFDSERQQHQGLIDLSLGSTDLEPPLAAQSEEHAHEASRALVEACVAAQVDAARLDERNNETTKQR